MNTRLRASVAGITLLALAVGVYLVGQGQAQENKDAANGILKIAAALKKGDNAGAKTLAEALAKKMDLEDVMDLLKPRKKGGLGVGKAGLAQKDGIELTLIDLGRDVPTANRVGKEAEAWEDMSYVLAAVAEVTIARAPKADQGKKSKKDWLSWSQEMYDGSVKLAAAAKNKGAQEIKTAATKVNGSCNSCHSAFR